MASLLQKGKGSVFPYIRNVVSFLNLYEIKHDEDVVLANISNFNKGFIQPHNAKADSSSDSNEPSQSNSLDIGVGASSVLDKLRNSPTTTDLLRGEFGGQANDGWIPARDPVQELNTPNSVSQGEDNSEFLATLEISENRISWPNDGWYQVQELYTHKIVSQGEDYADLPAGAYRVLNLTTGDRADVILLSRSDIAIVNAIVNTGINPPESRFLARLEISESRISWPNDGWYQVQELYTHKIVSQGEDYTDLPAGAYRVLNLTTGDRADVITLGSIKTYTINEDGSLTITIPDGPGHHTITITPHRDWEETITNTAIGAAAGAMGGGFWGGIGGLIAGFGTNVDAEHEFHPPRWWDWLFGGGNSNLPSPTPPTTNPHPPSPTPPTPNPHPPSPTPPKPNPHPPSPTPTPTPNPNPNPNPNPHTR